ncbi:FxsA family protein [Helicobacter sp. 16-1353]|uniref:FxsA family protein n=1 Tax=Helicobacter sp. 16-1353 TaxID=2004996 RepID=UPI0015EFB620|nr:FxsA family protein [Helicobacter sp. 16-1353]
MRLILFIVYLFVEIYLIVSFADEFGILSLFLEILLSAFVGIGILATQYRVMIESYNSIFRSQNGIGNFIGKSFFRLIGGILLIVPGILSDVIGLSFFIISLFFPTKLKNDSNPNDFQEFRYSSDFSGFQDSKNSKDNPEIIDVEIIEDNKNLKN